MQEVRDEGAFRLSSAFFLALDLDADCVDSTCENHQCIIRSVEIITRLVQVKWLETR